MAFFSFTYIDQVHIFPPFWLSFFTQLSPHLHYPLSLLLLFPPLHDAPCPLDPLSPFPSTDGYVTPFFIPLILHLLC